MPGAIVMVKKYFPNVVTVRDATRNVAIAVTERDERESQKKAHTSCAMAVACKRVLGLDGVIVSVTKAFLIKGAVAIRYDLPPSVSREVVSFDRGAGFLPGEYALSKPAHRLGRKRGTKTDSKAGVRKREYVHMTEGIRTVLGAKDIS